MSRETLAIIGIALGILGVMWAALAIANSVETKKDVQKAFTIDTMLTVDGLQYPLFEVRIDQFGHITEKVYRRAND